MKRKRQMRWNMERVRDEVCREGRQNCEESGSMFEQQRTKQQKNWQCFASVSSSVESIIPLEIFSWIPFAFSPCSLDSRALPWGKHIVRPLLSHEDQALSAPLWHYQSSFICYFAFASRLFVCRQLLSCLGFLCLVFSEAGLCMRYCLFKWFSILLPIEKAYKKSK